MLVDSASNGSGHPTYHWSLGPLMAVVAASAGSESTLDSITRASVVLAILTLTLREKFSN